MHLPTYSRLAKGRDEDHPVDDAVAARLRSRLNLKAIATASSAIVQALGSESHLWFRFEELSGKRTDLREELYFDIGVNYGLAAARTSRLQPERRVERIAKHLVEEALASAQSNDEAASAAVLAAWSLLSSTGRGE